MASRMRWHKCQADLYVIPNSREICEAEMPFFDAHISWIASNHFRSSICESSKIVPTLTVNCWRQPPHFQRPRREVLPCSRYDRSTVPQCGQVGSPLGQTMPSTHLIASSSEAQTFAISARFMAQSPYGYNLGVERGVVKYIIASQ